MEETDYTRSLPDDHKEQFLAKVKEKVIELTSSFKFVANTGSHIGDFFDQCICATRVAEEVLKVIPMYKGNLNPEWAFWQQVKLGIENYSVDKL